MTTATNMLTVTIPAAHTGQEDITFRESTYGALVNRADNVFDAADLVGIQYRAGRPFLVLGMGDERGEFPIDIIPAGWDQLG